MKYDFAVVVQVSAEADFENGRSKMISCNVNLLSTFSTVEAGWKHKDGIVTEAGMKVQTVGLIQGLVAQLHFGHQMALWDKDEHYRRKPGRPRPVNHPDPATPVAGFLP